MARVKEDREGSVVFAMIPLQIYYTVDRSSHAIMRTILRPILRPQ